MTYIVLDLEWSQPVCREKMRIAGTRVLQVEIIQIGAVAVTDGIVSEDFFSEYVRPRYYTELKGRIKKLTGITKNDLKNAHDLTVVLKSFRKWLEKFGKDVIIVTWGPDDIPTLVKQCEFYERDTGWLPEWFNLQPLMTRQYGIDRAQITLQSAVEITGVQQELDYHSAINDAYYTALVLTKINDIPSEIELQKKIDYVHSNPFLSLRQTSEGTVKTARMNAVPRLSELNRYICPVCGKPATLKSRLIWLSPMNYMAVVHCNKHSVKVTVRFEKKADGEYRWIKKYTLSEEKDEDVQIIADPEQLKRVVNNIVGNSVKYLDKQKGFINIRIKDVGDFIQVEIEDNGRGIAARDLPYIFDRFYRTDSSRNSSKGGSGIGLSIVRKIIEDHGGKIWATSKEGIGTEIHFVLRKYQEVIHNNEENSDH